MKAIRAVGQKWQYCGDLFTALYRFIMQHRGVSEETNVCVAVYLLICLATECQYLRVDWSVIRYIPQYCWAWHRRDSDGTVKDLCTVCGCWDNMPLEAGNIILWRHHSKEETSCLEEYQNSISFYCDTVHDISRMETTHWDRVNQASKHFGNCMKYYIVFFFQTKVQCEKCTHVPNWISCGSLFYMYKQFFT
jgi:hypothetical protein